MPKQFYTERDMDDLVKRGVQSLQVTDQVVLTPLAYERAKQLGIQLVQDHPENLPGAPLRPYISNIPTTPVKPASAPQPPDATSFYPATSAVPAAPVHGALHDRILNAVHARLGDQIEPELLENIIQRVLNSLGMK